MCGLFSWCFCCLCDGDNFYCRRFAAIGISDDFLDGGFFVFIHDVRILMRHGKGGVPEEFLCDGHGDTRPFAAAGEGMAAAVRRQFSYFRFGDFVQSSEKSKII